MTDSEQNDEPTRLEQAYKDQVKALFTDPDATPVEEPEPETPEQILRKGNVAPREGTTRGQLGADPNRQFARDLFGYYD